jgi:hypothetical protein
VVLLLVPLAAAHVPFARGTTTITEVHAGPAADGGQWFEVRNNATNGQNLVEQVFTDADGDSFQVTLTLIVRPGEYAVFASAESPVERDVTLPAGFDLRPEAGAVLHTDLLGVVDEVVWDATWGVGAALPHQLDGGLASNEWANDRPANWCPDPTGSAAGTPGTDNTRCPGVETDDDGDGVTELDGDCDDRNASVYPGAPDGTEVPDDGDCDGTRDEDGPGDTGDTAIVDTGDTAPVDTAETGDTADTGDTAAPDTGDTADSARVDTADTDSDTAPPSDDAGCGSGCRAGSAWMLLLSLTGAVRSPRSRRRGSGTLPVP